MTDDIQDQLTQFNNKVDDLYEQGQYEAAIPYATQAVELSRKISGDND